MKITGLPARVTALLTDIVAIVDAASGTPATWKATLAQLRAAFMPIVPADFTGTLPVAKGGTGIATVGTGLQYWRTNAGATAGEWATLAAGSSAGGAGQMQTSDGAGAFTAPTNVMAGANFVSIGALPAAGAGNPLIRVPSAPGEIISVRNVGNTDDKTVISATATGITIGDASRVWSTITLNGASNATVTLLGFNISLYTATSNGTLISAGAGGGVNISDTQVLTAHPVIGMASASSPFGLHGMTVKAMTGTTDVLTAAEMKNFILKVTGTGTNIIKYPAATDAAAYTHYVWNTGTGTLGVADGTAQQAAALLAAGTGALFMWVGSAVKQLTPAFAVA